MLRVKCLIINICYGVTAFSTRRVCQGVCRLLSPFLPFHRTPWSRQSKATPPTFTYQGQQTAQPLGDARAIGLGRFLHLTSPPIAGYFIRLRNDTALEFNSIV